MSRLISRTNKEVEACLRRNIRRNNNRTSYQQIKDFATEKQDQSTAIRAASSKFGTYRQCEQRRFRRACASAQSRQNLRCSLIQAVRQEEPSNRKPDPWPLLIGGHAQFKFVMTECSKTQFRLTRPNYKTKKSLA